MSAVLVAFVIYITGSLIVSAIDNLTSNIAELKTTLDAFLAASNTSAEAQIQTAADAIKALTAEIQAKSAQPTA